MTIATKSLLEAFEELRDPRARSCSYQLDELLLAAICAIISGAESWTSVVEWSEMKLDWLRQHRPFANGIASHDTFGRVFSLLDARQFEACFMRWMSALCPSLDGRHIAIDGKCVRGSHDGANSAIHLVSAWSSASGLTLGQIRTADKSNEITAIPQLLDALDVKGAIITIDAMGCQHDIAAKIVERGADYVLGVKDNQPGLAEAVKLWFDAADAGKMDRPFWDDIQIEKDHGRIETRRCLVTNDVAWLQEQRQHWSALKSLIMIESTREIIGRNGTGTASVERRYYISSVPAKAALLGNTVRAHWGIENSMHWVLDVAFREDDCRIRVGEAAQNFAILRRIALNLLKRDKSTKLGIANKRLKAGWNVDYLGKLLGLAT
ncbi:MAG: ISAs1 family transposase [Burkholderiaceae bacterium]|nr:ISAs1 family transposase [Burkholderiaceae bacterium]